MYKEFFRVRAVSSPLRVVYLCLFVCGVSATWASGTEVLAGKDANAATQPSVGVTPAVATTPEGYETLSDSARAEWLKRMPAGLVGSKKHLAKPQGTWRLHQGDLHIKGAWLNDQFLLVNGNVTLEGNYDDQGQGSSGALIVLGNFRAQNVVSAGHLSVSGQLDVQGIVHAHGRSQALDVVGTLTARALVVQDRDLNINKTLTTINLGDVSDEQGQALAVREMVPELLTQYALEHLRREPGSIFWVPDAAAVRQWLSSGKPIFRPKPAPDRLIADIQAAASNKTQPSALAAMVRRDALVATIVAARPDISPAAQTEIVRTGHASALEVLAGNPKVQPRFLPALAQATPAAAVLVARNQQTPDALVTQLARHAYAPVRMALAQRVRLPEAVVSKLATDSDAKIRATLVERAHAQKLPALAFDALVQDPDARVRRAVALYLRTPEQYAAFAADADAVVRENVAAAIAAQALYQARPVLPAAERETLARLLSADAVLPVRVKASVALPVVEQEQMGRAALKQAQQQVKNRADAVAIAYELAAGTTSATLMQEFAQLADPGIRKRLATNLALTQEVQERLLVALPEPASRKPVLLSDRDAWAAHRPGVADEIAELLALNPNLKDAVALRMAQHCAKSPGDVSFCVTLMHRPRLPLAALELLKEAGSSRYQQDFALAALGQVAASRALVEHAASVWFKDEKLRVALEKNRKLEGDAWWLALAQSPWHQLREIAAANQNTPPAALERLARDREVFVVKNVALNPTTPLKVLAKLTPQSAWLLLNPALNMAQLDNLLHQSELGDPQITPVDVWMTIAARQLRAGD